MLLFYFISQIFYNRHGRLDTQIAHDQGFFDLFIEIVINSGKTAENRVNSRYNIVSGLCKPFYQSAKKPFFPSAIRPLLYICLFCQAVFYKINRNKGGYALLLHGNSVKPVSSHHGAAAVGDHNKLGIFRQFVKIICKAVYVGVI